jgi:hypothetical protein
VSRRTERRPPRRASTTTDIRPRINPPVRSGWRPATVDRMVPGIDYGTPYSLVVPATTCVTWTGPSAGAAPGTIGRS